MCIIIIFFSLPPIAHISEVGSTDSGFSGSTEDSSCTTLNFVSSSDLDKILSSLPGIEQLVEAISTQTQLDSLWQEGENIGVFPGKPKIEFDCLEANTQAKYLVVYAYQGRLENCIQSERWFKALSDHGVPTDVLDKVKSCFYKERTEFAVRDQILENLDIDMLCNVLKWSYCTNLILTNCGIDDNGCQVLADALSSCKALYKLEVKGNEINSHSAENLAGALKHCPLLEYLNMAVNRIDDTGAAALAEDIQHCTQLRAFNISFNFISDTGALSLTDINLKHSSSLKVLDLQYNRIGTEGAQAVARAVQHRKELSVRIGNHNIVEDDADSVLLTLKSEAEAFIVVSNMQADTEHCEISALTLTFSVSSFTFLDDILRHYPNLQTLTLKDNVINHDFALALMDSLQHCSNLHMLDLRENGIDSNSANAFANGLQHCSKLHMLYLGWNDIGSDSAKALANGLQHCSNLHMLDLGWNNIGSDSAKALADGLRHCSNLHTLGLEGNRIGSYGAKALADGLRHCSNLHTLDLGWNHVGNDGAKLLANGLRHCSKLHLLNLKGNSIGSDGIKALTDNLQHCSNLHCSVTYS